MRSLRATAVVVALLWSCADASPEPSSLRLVDRVAEATVTNRPAALNEAQPAAWTFSDADTAGWRAAAGVDGLRVEDGALVGRSTDAQPILHVAWRPTIDAEEPVHAIEVRMAASRPGTLRAELLGAETFALDPARDLLRSFSRGFEVPIIPGEEAQTYTLESSWGVTAGAIRQLVLLPTNTPDSDFRIESVRVIFRREHLAEIPSGVGWQGLGEIYRETLVARSPERWRFSLDLPEEPLLDLTVGTVEEDPVTFRVDVMTDGEPLLVFERTLARPQAWSPAQVDLGRWAGRTVDLRLTVRAEREGALGFWGSPAVRRRIRTSSGERPLQGVILVVADTLRRDHLSLYGYERDTSPVLTRLAASHPGAPPPLEVAATAVIADGWKLVHHTAPPPGVPEIELFDRARDPEDLHDVAARHPETVAHLLDLLASWREGVEASRLPRGEQAAEGLSQQELERLRSLGYI